jgi:hypothetical protein
VIIVLVGFTVTIHGKILETSIEVINMVNSSLKSPNFSEEIKSVSYLTLITLDGISGMFHALYPALSITGFQGFRVR